MHKAILCTKFVWGAFNKFTTADLDTFLLVIKSNNVLHLQLIARANDLSNLLCNSSDKHGEQLSMKFKYSPAGHCVPSIDELDEENESDLLQLISPDILLPNLAALCNEIYGAIMMCDFKMPCPALDELQVLNSNPVDLDCFKCVLKLSKVSLVDEYYWAKCYYLYSILELLKETVKAKIGI